MSRKARALVRLLGVVSLAVVACPASAKAVDWDRVANIKEAATRLANIQKRQGATKAFNFIIACYKTQGLASKYSKYFEACIAQDYIHTQALATIYSRMPPAALKKIGAPSPKLLSEAMGHRITGAFQKYSVPAADAEAFKKLVDLHGFQTFTSIVFPKPKGGKQDDAMEDEKRNGDGKDSEKNVTP